MKRNSLRTHFRSIAGPAPSGLIMARIRLARTQVAVMLLLLLMLAFRPTGLIAEKREENV